MTSLGPGVAVPAWARTHPSEIGPSGACVRHSGYHGTPAFPLTRSIDLLPLFQPPFRIDALAFEGCYCPRRKLTRSDSSGAPAEGGAPST